MSKAKIILLSVFLFIALMCLLTETVWTYSNEPDGFRDIKWQTPKESISRLRISEEYGSYKEYLKERENLDFNGIQATKILYGFTENLLETVNIQFEPRSEEKFILLKNKLESKYGKGEKIGAKDIFWKGETTNIKLNLYTNGVKVTYSNNKTFSNKISAINEFNNKLQKYWNDLLKDCDSHMAVIKIKQWLNQEGKEILDSYYVSPNGEKISLTFKGGGMRKKRYILERRNNKYKIKLIQ